MGQNIDHGLGRNGKYFINPESTFGTFAAPAAGDAARLLSLAMTHEQDEEMRIDSRPTRSNIEEIRKRKTTSWNMSSYLVPSGAAGTAPDIADIIKGILPNETVAGGVSVKYEPTEAQNLGGLTLVREYNGLLMEAVIGAWVEELTISVSGGEEARVTASGNAVDHIVTAYAVTTVELFGAEVIVTVGADNARNFEVGSMITVGDSTEHEVTGVVVTTGVLSVTPGIVGTQAIGVPVIPYVPSETVAGSPLSGLSGSLTLDDGSSIPITSFELSIKGNNKAIDDEAFTDAATDYVPGYLEVTGSFGIRARRDQVIILNRAKSFETRDLDVTIGDTAGERLIITCPTARLKIPAIDVPEAEEATATISFVALSAGSGLAEVDLFFN